MVSLSPLSSGLHSSLFYTRYTGKTSLAKMIVLFFPTVMVSKETYQVPLQSPPFSVYPRWQVQGYDPLVFVQVAFTWQEWFPLHSSISEKPLINFALYDFMIHSYIIPLIIAKYATKYVDRGNSVHKHTWITLLKIMKRLTKMSYIWKYQNYLNMSVHRRCIPLYMCICKNHMC